ncbi:MAG: hypothetical protein M1837_001909 [Sclerophora amabilis]|nr:MAG: hypothetical protein M1837_001909 [Sclerophora amabilis]
MASFSSTLSQMLSSITTTKINELSNQQASFEDQLSTILKGVNEEPDLRERIRLLLDGLKSLDWSTKSQVEASDLPSSRTDLSADISGVSPQNIRRFLDQSRCDPSIPTRLLEEWETQLKQRMNTQSLKYKYATLFGQLITEWTSTQAGAENGPSIPANAAGEVDLDDTKMQDSFEEVGRTEMHEQRQQFEKYVFNPLETDVAAIDRYLTKLFTSSKESEKAVKVVREKTKNFGEYLISGLIKFDDTALKWCIRALLTSDLLSDEKRVALNDLSRNKVVLTEVADVLNMRLATLDRWSWGPDGIPLEIRRQLNGRYRVFMDEDILQALFIQFIGTHWAVHFKTVFTKFFKSSAWTPSSKPIPKQDRRRREYFLDLDDGKSEVGIQDERSETYLADYFMTQLPSTVDEGERGYDSDESEDGIKTPVQVKQALLHILSAESILQKELNSDFTIVRSDFKWFGPSVPHSSIFAVLRFFDTSPAWIDFFKRFLEAPLQFVQDGPDAPIQIRKRGVPMCHTLSTVFGEVILFCMDYSVNQKANGALLYRLHDDSWIWGQEETCVAAWQTMTEFTKLVGLSFNEEKTGALRIVGDKAARKPLSKVLPTKGQIRWGFLYLDSATGRFLIDQAQVDLHIIELKRQLSACKSVFAYVQAWNSYVGRFLVTNFGQPANCFGQAHVDMMIETLERVQRELFADTKDDSMGGGVTQHLRKMIEDRFGVTGVPDGFFYFPVGLGGLDLCNPFISLFGLHGKIYKDPRQRIAQAFEKEQEWYNKCKEAFETGRVSRTYSRSAALGIERTDGFMSREEYARYRELTSYAFREAYKDLCGVPVEGAVERTPEVETALSKLLHDRDGRNCAIRASWLSMKPYHKWLVQLYAPEMISRFGSLSIVEKGLLPIGMVDTLRSGKVRWQG